MEFVHSQFGAPSVLVVEDEYDTRAVMTRRIAAAGYAVFEAADGLDAWDKIQNHHPKIVILDMVMPRLDGFGLLKLIRDHKATVEPCSIIAVSARSDVDDFCEDFYSLTDFYIQKPCLMSDILDAIELMFHQIRC
jgi:DNA-binding response OmpR family regulator